MGQGCADNCWSHAVQQQHLTRRPGRLPLLLLPSGACCQGKKAQLKCLWGPTLYHRDDLPYSEALSDLPNTFTPFREKVEKKCQVRAELPAPRAGQLPLPASLAASLQQRLDAPLPSWQELPWPAGHVPQQPAADNPKAALQFKVGASGWLLGVAHVCQRPRTGLKIPWCFPPPRH